MVVVERFSLIIDTVKIMMIMMTITRMVNILAMMISILK
jgi:hypothetical protein